MTTVNLNITTNSKTQGLRLKLKFKLNFIPHHEEGKLIVITRSMKYLFFNIIFKLLINLPYMGCCLYFFEVRIGFFRHLSILNDIFTFFSNFFNIFPLFNKVFLFKFLHIFICVIENFETMRHWNPLYSLYELLCISCDPLLICNLSKVNVNIVNTNGTQLLL
jgi:hypothetical protein